MIAGAIKIEMPLSGPVPTGFVGSKGISPAIGSMGKLVASLRKCPVRNVPPVEASAGAVEAKFPLEAAGARN